MPALRMRLAIIGSSPCHLCHAACCRQNGHAWAVLLQTDQERRRFAPWAKDVPIRRADGAVAWEKVLPYADGKCQFLGEDGLCTIYEDRPLSCRQFECVPSFNQGGTTPGDHGLFLKRNPRVLKLLAEL